MDKQNIKNQNNSSDQTIKQEIMSNNLEEEEEKSVSQSSDSDTKNMQAVVQIVNPLSQVQLSTVQLGDDVCLNEQAIQGNGYYEEFYRQYKEIDYITYDKKYQYVSVFLRDRQFSGSYINQHFINQLEGKCCDEKSQKMEELVKNIRTYYSMKQEYNGNLEDCQQIIDLQPIEYKKIDEMFPKIRKYPIAITKRERTAFGFKIRELHLSKQYLDIIKWKPDDFQITASYLGVPLIVKGGNGYIEFLNQIMKRIRSTRDTMDNEEDKQFNLILQSKDGNNIEVKARLDSLNQESSIYLQLEVLQLIKEEPSNDDNQDSKRNIDDFQIHEQFFIDKYIQKRPENEIPQNKNRVCGYRMINKN